ncbi:MAG: Hpt domain-containing protein [Selenomonadaceae bacterium]|nr:Hpt domain-containing protein [Selenomonadaceae bacterium]
MGLKDLFLNVAEDYQKGNRAEKIEALYEAKDIKGYRIAVHALKSTSGTLGANRLEQMAKEQEMAAKAEDWETVMQNHKALMDAYAQLRLGLGKWLAEL